MVWINLYDSHSLTYLYELQGKCDSIVYYGQPSRQVSNMIHSYGFQVIYAIDALHAVNTWVLDGVQLQTSWCQHDNSSQQPFSDGFVFEYIGAIEENNSNYQAEIDAIVTNILNARTLDGLTKPITLIAMTGRQDVYDYLIQKAAENNFNIWTSWRFLAGLPTPPYA